MKHYEILQSINAIAGLGILVYFSYRLKYFLKRYLKAASR